MIFSHFSNSSLGNLVLSGSVWSGKRRLPKDGPPTSFAKRMTPSWQECAMCILSKHQHQFNWKIEAQFLLHLSPDFPPFDYFQLFNSWINPRWLSVPTRPAFTSPQSETCAQSFLSLLSLCSGIIIVLHFIILTFHPCPHP